MQKITSHIINPTITINKTPANTVGHVEACSAVNFVKTKKRYTKKCITLNSILKNAYAVPVRIKLYVLQIRKSDSSVSATWCKGKYFLMKVLTCSSKPYNTIHKRYAKTINRHKTQMKLSVNNIASTTAEPFLEIGEESSNNLKLSKIYKNEKNYLKS